MDNEQLLQQIGGMFGQVNQQMGELAGQMGQLSRRMDAMETRLNQRMDGIDERLGRVEETLTRVAVTQENVVLPALKQLAEGHEELTRQIGVVSTQVERNTEAIELHTVQIAGLQAKVKALA